MGAVGRTETCTEGTVETGAIGVAGGTTEGTPMSVAAPSPSKVSINKETYIQIKEGSQQGATQIYMYNNNKKIKGGGKSELSQK